MKLKLSARGISVVLALVLVGGLLLTFVVNKNSSKEDSVLGCYVAHLAQDRYTLEITSQVKSAVMANIAYENFEKDSSKGTFVGKYTSGVLSGMYTFTSEGMNSQRELFFKRDGKDFLAGFGPVTSSGDTEKFTRPLQLTWDQSYRYVKSKDCSPSLP
ncbi:MAG: hypothetical protein WDO06_03180 [Actinomycetota bacterium]